MLTPSPTICYLTSCQASDDTHCPEDHFWPFKMLEINVKATFIASPETEEEEGKNLFFKSATGRSKRVVVVHEESHKLPLDQLLNNVVSRDWEETNIWDVFDSMQIPIEPPTLDKIVGCALDMAAKDCHRKVLRMQVEIETLVDYCELDRFEELDDVYCIDVEAEDFWETVEAFRRLRRTTVVEEEEDDEFKNNSNNLCSICLGELLVGSEVSVTPCSHVFHDRCIRAWLKKCKNKKFCPNCVATLA